MKKYHRSGAGEETRIILKDMLFESVVVEKRKRLDGVALDVGEPVFRAVKHTTTLSLLPDQDYGIDIRVNDGQGFLRCRVRASFVAGGDSGSPARRSPQ